MPRESAARYNFGFHKWKNCSLDFSPIVSLFIVVKNQLKRNDLSFLSWGGVFMPPAKVCHITVGS